MMAQCAWECPGSTCSKACPGCGRPVREGREATCSQDAGGCGKVFCNKCCSYALVPPGEEKGGTDAPAYLFCKPCFKSNSLIDFSTTVDTFGPAAGTAPCILFVHGMLFCRTAFREHARLLSERHGFRCVCVDLPGHGSRMDEKITLASAMDAIESTVKEHCVGAGGMPVIASGHSLGGMLVMHMMGHRPGLFDGAIVSECNYVLGSKGTLGNQMRVWMMKRCFEAGGWMSNQQCFEMFRKRNKGGGVSVETAQTILLRAGIYEVPVPACAHISAEVDLLAGVRAFKGPVLFIYAAPGDEEQFKAVAQRGRFKFLEGAGHSFCHSGEYMDAFVEDMASVVRECSPEEV